MYKRQGHGGIGHNDLDVLQCLMYVALHQVDEVPQLLVLKEDSVQEVLGAGLFLEPHINRLCIVEDRV